MINLKSFKWGYGVVVFFSIGMTGCYMDGYRSQQMEPMQPAHHQKMVTNEHQAKAKAMHKTSATAAKEPVQQVAPGPKRKAAPQLPVIQ